MHPRSERRRLDGQVRGCIINAGSVVWLLFGIASLCRAEPLVLTEFMAENNGAIVDEDGDLSDWIEISNVSDDPVSYGGWTLTDDADRLSQWELPDGELGPGEYLVVFASGKDRATSGAELHTNFRLSGRGEYLALVRPDGNSMASQFRPQYPPQFNTASFGVEPQTNVMQVAGAGTSVRYFVPTDDSLGDTWLDADFDDSGWAETTLPIGFDHRTGSPLQPLMGSDLSDDMLGVSPSLYVRIALTVADPGELASLVMRVRYADGFVLYANGVEVARRGVFGTPLWFSSARGRRDAEIVEPESIDLSAALSSLRRGANVIAVQAVNNSSLNDVFLFAPKLDVIEVIDQRGPIGYFAEPSPGWANVGMVSRVATAPGFSLPSGVINGDVLLELTSDVPGAVIRYSLDRAPVHMLSTVYSEPFVVDSHIEVQARVFAPDSVPSPTATRHYVAASADAALFSSNLPIVVVQSFGVPIGGGFVDSNIFLFEPRPERTDFQGVARLASGVAIKTRGSSSGGRPKASYRLEFQDERGRDRSLSVLGMPAESDWILYGAFNFDHTHMRNPLIYRLSNEVGRWAAHTQFCELFVVNGGLLRSADYFGIYSFMESVKRDENRVDIQELYRGQVAEPDVSGGYIVKIDRRGPGDRTISVTGHDVFTNEPSGTQIVPEQLAWVGDYMNAFVASLGAPDVSDPGVPLAEKSYAQYINVVSWIDHHLLNVFPKNVDALRLSTYFHKDRGGLLNAGPIWDFDRSMGSTDGRDESPTGWVGGSDATRYFDFPWWAQLTDDPVFWEHYQDRWFELRQGPLATVNFVRIIDGWADELGEASARDSERWSRYTPEGFFEEVDHLKWWLSTRASWIDSQFLPTPVFETPGGLVDFGSEVSVAAETGEIYYTLNGDDPKTDLDAISPSAIRYTGPIPITVNVRITARIRVEGLGWGNLADEVYATEFVPLIVSEIMYNPARLPDSDFRISDYEYIEIQNVGDEPVGLAGIRIGFSPRALLGGRDVDGNELTVLRPGEFLLVVKNLEAFRSRYDAGGAIVANVYERRNDSLSNLGQEIIIFGAVGEEVLRFAYDEEWHPSTNGGGYSLVPVQSSASRDRWGEASSWRPSYRREGSPGREDVQTESLQLPADMTQDGRIDVADAIGMIRHLFAGVAAPCATDDGNRTLLDANGDTRLDLTDTVHVLNYVFSRGEPPALGVECLTIGGCSTVCR